MSKREKIATADGHVAKHVTHGEPHEEKKDVPAAAADAPSTGKRKAEEDIPQPFILRPALPPDTLLAIVARALHVEPKASAHGGARAGGSAGVAAAH